MFRQRTGNKQCGVESCLRQFYAKGFCEMHYCRVRKYDDPNIVRDKSTHRKSHTQMYWIWAAMLDRCRNPNNKRYARYGGRGIKVCPEWIGKSGFSNFYACVGNKPIDRTLDRINNDGDYEPKNVRWATASTQIRNRGSHV